MWLTIENLFDLKNSVMDRALSTLSSKIRHISSTHLMVATALIPKIRLLSGLSNHENHSTRSVTTFTNCPSPISGKSDASELVGHNETSKPTVLVKRTSSRSRRYSKILSDPGRCEEFRIFQLPKMKEPNVPASFNIVSVKKELPYIVNKFRRDYPKHLSHKSRRTSSSVCTKEPTKLFSTKYWTLKRSLSVDMNMPAKRMFHDSASRTTWEENEHLKAEFEDPETREEEVPEEENNEESPCLETSGVIDEEEKTMSEREAFLANMEQAEEDFLNMLTGHKEMPLRVPPETFDPWAIKTEADKHPLTQKSIMDHWRAKKDYETNEVMRMRSPLKKPKPNALKQSSPFTPKKSSSMPKLENKDGPRCFVRKPSMESVIKVKLHIDNAQDEEAANSGGDFLSILSQNSEKHSFLVNKIKVMQNRMHNDENIVFSNKPPYISLD